MIRTARHAVAALALIPAALAGQSPRAALSPDSAVAIALRESPEVAAARATLRAAEANLRQASTIANPTLSWQYERTSAGANTNSQHITTLEQPLAFGQRGARRDAAAARVDVAVSALRAAELDVAVRVARAYAALGAAERRASIARTGSEEFARALVAMQARRDAGDISGYELRRSRLESARLATQRAARDAEVRVARRELAALLAPHAATPGGAPSSVEGAWAAIADVAGSTATRDPQDVSDSLIDARPDVAIAAARAREADAAAALAAWERIPVPSLVGGLKTERAAGLGALSGIAAGVSIPLPLFDRRTAASTAAGADAESADAALAAVRRSAGVEIANAGDALRTALAQIAALAPALGDEATRAVDAARLAYTEGEIPLDAWLLALRAFADAEDAYTTLLADAFVLRAEYARAIGRLPSWNTP